MESIYNVSVKDVPADYNEPTKTYKNHVWIAVAGIIAFFIFYLFLTYWFFSAAYRLLADAIAGGNSSLLNIGIGICSLLLGIFMIKAFFFVKASHEIQDREVKAEEEPILFDYLYKLADEIGAPRPYKVYLSNRVNACVFYELSFLNLFFPSKKNLEVGLGLINVLNLGEFKAVLAHEYGHFAQKSMLIGRWVYIANQIANTIIYKRDALDTFLVGLSRFDIRVAWIGWILSLIIWSIRSLVELIFRVVVLSQRALSREMEFQADLVAVSVTGSDALIHALHKLQAADNAFSEALNTTNELIGKEKSVSDIYALQTNAIVKTAYVLNDKEYGASPKVPETNPENHRVFSDKIAQPPKMWLTHPPDQEREANAKNRYISGVIDERSAWALFQNPAQTKLDLTADLMKAAKVKFEALSKEEMLSFHNKQFDKSYFKPKYKGAYLNRFITHEYSKIEDVYLLELNKSTAEKKLNSLYPESLIEDLEDYKTLKEEKLQLEAILENRLSASNAEGEKGIWHRGKQISRKEMPEIIQQVGIEEENARIKVADHDRLCRTVNLRLAQSIGNGWEKYLKGLLKVVHFTEHQILNLNDAMEIFGRTLTVVMADGKVTDSEMHSLVRSGNDLHNILFELNKSRSVIKLDSILLLELDGKVWSEVLEELKFPPTSKDNINQWISSVESWVSSYIASLSKLRSEALEVLVRSEEQVQEMIHSGITKEAPAPSSIGMDYQTLLPGQERKMQVKLSAWDKFISADGIIPAVTKFAVAASIVGGSVFLAGTTGQSDISIYNGLGQEIIVDLDGKTLAIAPHSYKKTSLKPTSQFEVIASTQGGAEVERFKPDLESTSSHYVYNIASAAALYEYRIYYGGTPLDKYTMHGTKRWMTTKVDYLFEEPAESISASGNTTRDAIEALSVQNANIILSVVPNEEEQNQLIEAHTKWDPTDSPNTLSWIGLAGQLGMLDIVKQRLDRFPHEIMSLRTLMDNGSDTDKAKICELYEDLSTKNPETPNYFYISARCLTDGDEKNQAFIDGAKKWPTHGWMNYAAGFSYANYLQWEPSFKAYKAAYVHSPGLRDAIAINAKRIARLLEYRGVKVEGMEEIKSEYLNFYNSIETGVGLEGPERAFYLLNKGELEEAFALAKGSGDLETHILALCAASDGAKTAWANDAIKIETEGMNDGTLIAVAGLRLRKGLDIKSLTQFAVLQESEEADIMKFIDLVKANNFRSAETEMAKGSLSLQGHLCTLAYIAYGDKVPKKWKERANAFLFANERPYFKL